MSNVTLIAGLNASRGGTLDTAGFLKILEQAEPASPDTAGDWQFADWYRGTFVQDGMTNSFALYLGGLGLLSQPDGTRGLFRLSSDKAPAASTNAHPRLTSHTFVYVEGTPQQKANLDAALNRMRLVRRRDSPSQTIEDASALVWGSISIAAGFERACTEYKGFFWFSSLNSAEQDDRSFSSGLAVKKGTGEIYSWEKDRGQPGRQSNELDLVRMGDRLADGMLSETNYSKLVSLVKQCSSETNTVIRHSMCDALLRATVSNEPLRLENYGDLVIPSRVQAGKMLPRQGATVIKHDLFTRRGRAAWVLENVLACELPAVGEGTSDSEMREFEFEAVCKVKERFTAADRLISMSDVSAERRLALASGANTLGINLARLAKDPDVQVRRALASNPKAPVFVLDQLHSFDPDPEVRARALTNLFVARPTAD